MKKLFLLTITSLIGFLGNAQNDPVKVTKPVTVNKNISTKTVNTATLRVNKIETTITQIDQKIKELEKLTEQLKTFADQKDSLSELGEEQQLKLQMIMERRSKMETALSNIMKKFSDTANAITQNMK